MQNHEVLRGVGWRLLNKNFQRCDMAEKLPENVENLTKNFLKFIEKAEQDFYRGKAETDKVKAESLGKDDKMAENAD